MTSMTRTLLQELRSLRNERAPATVAASVLERLGIARARRTGDAPVETADRYATVKTVLGPVFVTFNDRGVTSVQRAANTGAFERAWERTHGRPIRRTAAPAWVA